MIVILEDGTLNTEGLRTVFTTEEEIEILDQYDIGILMKGECLGQLRACALRHIDINTPS